MVPVPQQQPLMHPQELQVLVEVAQIFHGFQQQHEVLWALVSLQVQVCISPVVVVVVQILVELAGQVVLAVVAQAPMRAQ